MNRQLPLLLLLTSLMAPARAFATDPEPPTAAPDTVHNTEPDAESAAASAADAAADEQRRADRVARQRAVAAAQRDPYAPGGWLRQGWTHFFAAEAGAARINGEAVWTGRLLLGPAYRREPSYLALPLMFDITEGSGVAVGAGIDILSQRAGTFMTLGGLVDPGDSGIFTASLGWQLFVVDVQVTARESTRNSQVFFKLRLPISTLIRAVTEQ